MTAVGEPQPAASDSGVMMFDLQGEVKKMI